ncbi:phospholipase D-like domain-containing protein [Beijerinckia mobilis]|uniref:phospholipase D-like domain-containing protein n=1 Tax=Beijerinckia mobilis TaxID=231434 RepID=UPI000A0442DF|nr:phospholipase D-like domain-containing protein [Beijerinckia mobilis]
MMQSSVRRRVSLTLLTASLILASVSALPHAHDQAAIELHYAPEENLERIDVALIEAAQHDIDLASYVLTDVAVIEALTRAAERGVIIRVYLYESQIYDHGRPFQALQDLRRTRGVTIKVKSHAEPLMHLKSYQIDGRLLRSGSANFSASGLKAQDNDMIIINEKSVVDRFKKEFDRMWSRNNHLVYKDVYPTFR